MRVLVLLRGTPSSGKSTWIAENELSDYTLSADNIRMLYRTPYADKNGKVNIDQEVNKECWKTLFNILEYRMSKGEFTIIDACNSKTSEMNLYKSLAEKYRYRMFCVDFTDIPIEQAKEWNRQRPEYKRVSDEVIDLYYSRFETQKVPSSIKLIKREDFYNEVSFRPIDLSEYKNVLVIGDIHGCYTALMELIENGIKEDTYYIFCGDYLDRGIENKQVLEFVCSIKDKSNVCLLEGNHEKHLWNYANGENVNSKDFLLGTQKEIADIDPKEIRQFYRKLRQCAYFIFDGKTYLVNHGGISKMHKDNLVLVATELFIKGVGKYEDVYDCQESFEVESDIVQIHGHRNPRNLPVKQSANSYNLEGRVEFGGCLRAVNISSTGIDTIEIKNNTYNKEYYNAHNQPDNMPTNENKGIVDIANLVLSMRDNSKQIIEKKFGNISSFNFKRDVFYDKSWNYITIKARGLFINTDNYTIAARAYDKFFNIGETKGTELAKLSTTLKFPVDCYLKYNGFLGILGYDEKQDDLLFCSKSNIGGDFANYFKDIFMQNHASIYDKVLKYVKDENVSLVFEVIDKDHDPHIIEYQNNAIVLLDIIKRDIKFEKLPYDELVEFGKEFGFTVKEKCYTLNNWGEFLAWYNEIMDEDYKYNGEFVEGFVVVDSNGFMTKQKGTYYQFWKFMRSVADETLRVSKNGNRQGYYRRTSALTTPLSNRFYGFLKKLCEENYDGKTDIITLRNLYFNLGAENANGRATKNNYGEYVGN